MRSRVLATAATALAVIATAAIPAAAASPSGHPSPGGGGASPGGRGTLAVASSTVLGPLHQQERVQARDNGQSVLYHGKSVWFFDDTILQNPFDFLSSTAAVTSDLDASDGIDLTSANPFDEANTGTPTNFVPATASETAFTAEHASADCTGSTDEFCGTQFAYWPGGAAVDSARHRILVSYGKLCRGAPAGTLCESGFIGHPISAGFVSVDMRTHQVTRLTAQHRTEQIDSPEGDDPTSFFTNAEDWGGAGMLTVGDRLYLYGDCDADTGCSVATVLLSRVQDMSQWRYYAGSSHGRPIWATDAASAVRISASGSAGGTVYWDSAFHAYVNVTMPALSSTAYYQTSPTPWGPWSNETALFTAAPSTSFTYAAFAHPEYTSRDGLTKYYTYYDSATGAQDLVQVRFTRSR